MSPRKQIDAPTVTRKALNRALLARQMLLEREPVSALDAIERLAGLQSQAPNPPYLGLWTRIQDFRHEELANLISERRAVRLALMRSTIHLVSSSDALAWRPLLQPVMDRMFESAYGRYLDGIDRDVLIEEGIRLVETQPPTFNDLGQALLERWPGRNAAAMANAIRTAAARSSRSLRAGSGAKAAAPGTRLSNAGLGDR